MKKFLIKVASYFAVVIVIDIAFGVVCDYLHDHTRGGFSGNVHYICELCDEDIIMMGSSRMHHHYVPQVFEDSLGMTCYNAGIDGNGIILSYGFLKMLLGRYIPKIIIYDVSRFDMYKDDNTKYLDGLKAYYYRTDMACIFKDVDSKECWKMMSSLYRYNSDFLGLLADNLHPISLFDRGYWPHNNVMNYEPETPIQEVFYEDSLKLMYVEKFIDLALKHNIKLIFAASPTYFGEIFDSFNNPVKNICKRRNVPFIDCYYDRRICSSKELWSDATHLNDNGAKIFSKKIIPEIKKCLY